MMDLSADFLGQIDKKNCTDCFFTENIYFNRFEMSQVKSFDTL